MQWVYMRYLSLSWKWTQATWMGMFESQLRQSQKSPHSLEISLKHFMNERLVQSSPCPERVDGGSFYKDCPPCLQRERWEGIAPPSHEDMRFYLIVIMRGACCPGTPGGRWKESEFPLTLWRCCTNHGTTHLWISESHGHVAICPLKDKKSDPERL